MKNEQNQAEYNDLIAKSAVLIEALPYLQKFRRKVFLIKIGGSVLEDHKRVKSLMRDIVLLEIVGIDPILVHGGGKAISKALKDKELPSKFIEGHRYTDADAIKIVHKTLSKNVNPQLVTEIISHNGRAEGICGTKIFKGKKHYPISQQTKKPIDIGQVGEITHVNHQKVQKIVDQHIVPVISPISKSNSTEHHDHLLNVNADLAAAALAMKLKVAKLIYLSDVRGVLTNLSDPKSLIPSISRSQAQSLIAEKTISAGMLPKVNSALKALDKGVKKVHFIDGRIQHSLLLEIFTKSGVGTQIIN